MASECRVSFVVNFLLSIDAAITLGEVSVSPVPGGFVSKHAWQARFTYVTGDPAAHGFRLTSADGLEGTFYPAEPETDGDATQVRNGICYGIVTVVLPEGVNEATFNGTITILQE